MKNPGRIAKIVIECILFILCGLFIFRCCMASDQSTLKELTVTEPLKAAYAADPQMEMITHKPPFEISEDGYMTAYALVMIPSIEQTQITVRYNDSIFSYNDLPADAALTFTLTDSVTGETISPSVTKSAKKWMYNYRRLVFDGVSLTEKNNLTVTILCGEEKITEMMIHHADQNIVNEPYRLSRAEKRALTEE